MVADPSTFANPFVTPFQAQSSYPHCSFEPLMQSDIVGSSDVCSNIRRSRRVPNRNRHCSQEVSQVAINEPIGDSSNSHSQASHRVRLSIQHVRPRSDSPCVTVQSRLYLTVSLYTACLLVLFWLPHNISSSHIPTGTCCQDAFRGTMLRHKFILRFRLFLFSHV